MVESDIPSSVINTPSSVFVTNQVGVDITAFDRMESSSIVRSLFGIGATNPTAIDLSTGIESCVDSADRYKIRSTLSDRGVSGVIWRFVHANRFMIELSKSWDFRGENFLSLALITLNEQTEQEPASTNVRELVRFGHNGVSFLDKTIRTVKYDFSISDYLQQLHDEHEAQLEQETRKGVEQEAMPVKARSTTIVGAPELAKKHRDVIIKFCNENFDHIETCSDELGKLINCDVGIVVNDEGTVVNILKDNSILTNKFEVQVFGNNTESAEFFKKIEDELQRNLPNDNYKLEPTSIMRIMRKNGMKLNVWGFDDQSEIRSGLTIYKVKFDRQVIPHVKKFEFVCNTPGVGLEVIGGMQDVECDLPINYPVSDVVLTINGIFNSRSIKDYVATKATLIGSNDFNDLTSERKWLVEFEMTPEALETEASHTDAQTNEEPLESQELENEAVIFEGQKYYLRKNGNCEGTEVDVITVDENVVVTSFCDPDVETFNFDADYYTAVCNITPVMLKDNSLDYIMSWLRPTIKPKVVDTPKIEKPLDEQHDRDVAGQVAAAEVAAEDLHAEERHEEAAIIEQRTEEIKEELKKEEEPMEELKIEVCETLKDCQEAIVSALKEILNEYGDDASNNVLSIETKLIAATEMDDIKLLNISGIDWFVDQQVPGPEEEQVPPAEEVQSADIHDQEVQMNLLRGIFEVADPAVTHVQKFLRKHLTEINHDGYLITETFPTETMLSWDTKPYDFTISIVKFKDGRFYRIFLAYTNPGLPDQTWLATKDIPGRWVKIGRDIQTNEFKPNFQGRRNNRY